MPVKKWGISLNQLCASIDVYHGNQHQGFLTTNGEEQNRGGETQKTESSDGGWGFLFCFKYIKSENTITL